MTRSYFTKFVASWPQIAYLRLRPAGPKASAGATGHPGRSFGSISSQAERESAVLRLYIDELRNAKELLHEVTYGRGQTLGSEPYESLDAGCWICVRTWDLVLSAWIQYQVSSRTG